MATHPFDLVVEGTAERVTDPDVLGTVAATYRQGGWPASVDGDALTAEFSAPAAGPTGRGTCTASCRQPSSTLGTAEPYGATRFDLEG